MAVMFTASSCKTAESKEILPPEEGEDTFITGSYSQKDLDESYDDVSANVDFSGDNATIRGSDAVLKSGQIKINEAGTYVFTGSTESIPIVVDAGEKDLVRLVLNAVNLKNSTQPPIYVSEADKCVIVVVDGTENFVTDLRTNAADDDPIAAIYSKKDLTINGKGKLTVESNYKEGIRCQDDLKLINVNLSVNSKQDAVVGKDTISIASGTYIITAGQDGFKTTSNSDPEKGFLVCDGGDFTVTSVNDAFQAETTLSLNGGTFQVVSGGGATNAPQRSNENDRGFWGAPTTSKAQTSSDTTAESEESSMKGFKAKVSLTVTGGNFIVDSADDAFHSNDSLMIKDGTFKVATGDDGFHADHTLTINDGVIEITKCYEGIEAANLTINGAKLIKIYSTDDGLNAGGGADGDKTDWAGKSGDYFILINGGTFDIYALGDGIDANGNLTIAGGDIKVSGPSMGMQGAIDFDKTFLVNGGNLITAGSSLEPSKDSEQPIILVSYETQRNSGDLISLKDSSGKTILSYTALTSFTASAFSSPELKVGSTFTLYINDTKLTDIKLTETVTGISDTGGAYSGGFGGGRGNGGGNRKPGGGQRPDGGKPPQGWPTPDGVTPPAPPDAVPPPADGGDTQSL
jgi:hypothetical protein